MIKFETRKINIADAIVPWLLTDEAMQRQHPGLKSAKKGNKELNNSVIPCLREYSYCYAEYEIQRMFLSEQCVRLAREMSTKDVAKKLGIPCGRASRLIAESKRIAIVKSEYRSSEDWVDSVNTLLNVWRSTMVDTSFKSSSVEILRVDRQQRMKHKSLSACPVE